MKKINKILGIAIVLVSFWSCDNYLDVNKDPNNPILEDVAPDLMLAGAMKTTADIYGNQLNRLGGTISGAWGGNVASVADPFGQEFRFNFTSSFNSSVWDDLYRRTSNYTNIVNYESDVNYANHKAIAKVMRAFYFQILVDLYGDIPYFEKHQYTELLQVPYDSDEVIYADLINEVEEAVNMIDNLASGAVAVGSEDIVYGGDMDKWKKFANTIKLRLVVRQSNVITDAEASALLSGLTAADFIGVNDGATVNPGYAQENDRQNPFYNRWGFSADGNTVRNNTIAASIFSLDILDGTLSGSTNDNRLQRMFTLNDNSQFQGIEQGQTLSGFTATGGISLLGPGFGVNVASEANASRDLDILTASESLFLQAEAVARGYMTGNGQALFNDAVQASFTRLGAGSAAPYLADIATTVGFGYTGSTEQKIEGIITQKWIALHTHGGVENWLEMTRTGYPNAPLPINQPNTQRPVKLLYPLSEIQGNTANLPSQQSTSDAFERTVFWN